MSEPERLDDADLRDLERRLRATALSPTSGRRDELLYACGREAGILETRQRARRWTATAAAVGVLAGAIVVAAIGDRARPVGPAEISTDLKPESMMEAPESKPQSHFEPRQLASERQRASVRIAGESKRLTAGMPFTEALALLDTPPATVERNDGSRQDESHRPLRSFMKDLP